MSSTGPRDSEVTVAVLLPEVLGTYSDAGNATVLLQRLRWRGIPARLLECHADDTPPTTCDIYLLGGGEDSPQLFAAEWLRGHPGLCNAIQDTATTLAVCAGLQVLGHSIELPDSSRRPGAGLLDLTTRPSARRAIGTLITTCELADVGELCGFENHQGATTLGPDARPLGRVVSGVGNGAGDEAPGGPGGGFDGACTEHIIGTYMHGPVLARNPELADHILARTVGGQLSEIELPEQAALRATYLGPRARNR